MRNVLCFVCKLCRLILRLLYWWYWEIPIRFNILALVGYFFLLYLIFGSFHVSEWDRILESKGIDKFWCIGVPFTFPVLLSIGAIMGGTTGNPSANAIDRAIQFRNGQMNISGAKKASEILEKTAHLDIINANKDSNSVFERAAQGFDSKYGASSPTKVFKDLMDED